jgi:hypothetical protein
VICGAVTEIPMPDTTRLTNAPLSSRDNRM